MEWFNQWWLPLVALGIGLGVIIFVVILLAGVVMSRQSGNNTTGGAQPNPTVGAVNSNVTSDDNKVTQLIATGVLTLVAVAGLWWYDVDFSTLINDKPLIALSMFIGLVTVMWCIVAYITSAPVTWAIPFGGAILIGMAAIGLITFVIGAETMGTWLEGQKTWIQSFFSSEPGERKDTGDFFANVNTNYIILLAIVCIVLGLAINTLTKKE